MKKIVVSYILSFIISFMVCIYEPIVMYANNMDDLWFNLNKIIGPLIILFILIFLCLCLVYSFIYFINNRFFKKIPIYKYSVIITCIIFFASYIQGNYLIYNLPALDGATIIWNKYQIDGIISLILWLVIIIITIIFIRKKGLDRTINYYKYFSFAIFGMLLVSFITTFFTTDVLKPKNNSYIFTIDNINNISTDKNFFLFMVDSVDAVAFDEVLKTSKYKDTFKDFSFFKDTVSAYGFTRDSIPFILSGKWNENKTNFLTYYNDAMDNSPLISNLEKRDYVINIYDMDMLWNTKNVSKVHNAVNTTVDVGKRIFYKQEAKYILYKYLPFFLKKYSLIETIDFNRCKNQNKYHFFDWNNKKTFDIFKSEKLIKISNKNFNYMHIEGAHVPFEIDENFKPIKNGTYEQKILATMNLTNEFINRLKKENLYDNSVIVILADHGFNYNEIDGRQNPILLIKGINEHHDMLYSDIPVSYEHLQDAYNDLLDGKKSNELFRNIDKTKPRRFLWYWLNKENHMVEYEQYGKAWDEKTLKATGKEFNR